MNVVWRGLLPLASLLAIVWLAVAAMEPPAPRPADAPPATFSAERAMASVREIARAPHPTGSREQARVRDYIVGQFRKLGMSVRVQKTIAWRDQGAFVRAAQVENIIARLPGRGAGDGKTVMLCAHYDSHNTGPGAGDDGAGVATLLETARALSGGAAACDVLFVVTDAEEAGLLGAEGFVQNAPEAKTVVVVLNFEARGGGGPVFMFETSEGNQDLIEHFASAPHPLASSLMYALYKLLPNDTDLTVFKQAGMPGLNFAFAGRWPHYHTSLDTSDGLDTGSLQQHGDYAVALAQSFRKAPSPAFARSRNAAYFDILGRVLFHYSLSLQWPLAGGVLTLFAVAGFRARADKDFWKGVSWGVALVPLMFIVGAVAAILLCRVIAPLRAQTPWNDPYDARLLEAAVCAITGGLIWLCGALVPTRFGVRPILLGALVWQSLLLILTLVFLPGASYLFLIPLLLLSLALLPRGAAHIPALAAALASLLLTVPVLHGIGLLLGFGLPPAPGILAALAAVPLCPLFRIGDTRQRTVPPVVLLTLGIIAVVAAFTRDAPSASRPRTDTLFYALDADRGTALWGTADTRTDVWTRLFLGAHPQPVAGTTFLPWSERTYLAAPAPRFNLPAPEIVRAGRKLSIRTRRDALEWVVAGSGVRAARMEGRALPVTPRKLFCLRFIAPPAEGVTLEVDAAPGTVLTVDDYTYRLPDGTTPRPTFLIAHPLNPLSDQTIVRTHIRL